MPLWQSTSDTGRWLSERGSPSLNVILTVCAAHGDPGESFMSAMATERRYPREVPEPECGWSGSTPLGHVGWQEPQSLPGTVGCPSFKLLPAVIRCTITHMKSRLMWSVGALLRVDRVRSAKPRPLRPSVDVARVDRRRTLLAVTAPDDCYKSRSSIALPPWFECSDVIAAKLFMDS